MLTRPSTCIGCPIHTRTEGFCHPSGSGSNGVLIVLESPGPQEILTGVPLSGPSGLRFEEMCRRINQPREAFRIHNTINCFPGMGWSREPWADDAIKFCSQYLDHTLTSMKPRCVVAAGAVAYRRLLPEVAVQVPSIYDARGYVFWSDTHQTWIIPTIHPAHIQRGQTALSLVVMHDLERAVDVAAHGFSYLDLSFMLLDPIPGEAHDWVRTAEEAAALHQIDHLSTDIETPDKGTHEDELDGQVRNTLQFNLDPDFDSTDIDRSFFILRCGYAYHDHLGQPRVISMPWGGVHEQFHRRLLALQTPKLFWNKGFDVPRIIAQRSMLLNGIITDGIESWHVLNSDLRRSLGFVSTFFNPRLPMWKHQSQQKPAWYNGIDAYAADVNHRESVKLLHKHKLWLVYKEQILDLDPVTTSMTLAGMPVDTAKRLHAAKVLTRMQRMVRKRMQRVVPLACRPLQPKEGYVRTPADTAGLMEVLFDAKEVVRCNRCGLVDPKAPHFKNKTNPVGHVDDACLGSSDVPTTKSIVSVDAPGTDDVEGKKSKRVSKVLRVPNTCDSAAEIVVQGGVTEVLFDEKSPHFKNKTVPVGKEDDQTGTGRVGRGDRDRPVRTPNPCFGAARITVREGVTRWAKVLPFAPSPAQILRYMAYHSHEPFKGKKAKGGSGPTTDKHALRKMQAKWPGDPLYGLIGKDRTITKIGGTYIGWVNAAGELTGGPPVGADERVHAVFTNQPSTLRTSVQGPNLQNLPKGGDPLARLAKSIYVAREFEVV